MQVKYGIDRVICTLPRLYQLAQGSNTVGTGLNTKKVYLYLKSAQDVSWHSCRVICHQTIIYIEQVHVLQETFLGHMSPISCCRFSMALSGIWTYDSSTSASRNATIYCEAEIMSLEWDCKSDRLCSGPKMQPCGTNIRVCCSIKRVLLCC